MPWVSGSALGAPGAHWRRRQALELRSPGSPGRRGHGAMCRRSCILHDGAAGTRRPPRARRTETAHRAARGAWFPAACFRPPCACGHRAGIFGGVTDTTEGTWTLYADGAARGNPGPAASGFVLDDPSGAPRAAGGVALGRATNNVAEYRALTTGLTRALELGVASIEVCMDSELVVRQMTGVYRVKHEGLKPLFAEAQALARRFGRFAIRHIPRAQNARADAEANRILDGG